MSPPNQTPRYLGVHDPGDRTGGVVVIFCPPRPELCHRRLALVQKPPKKKKQNPKASGNAKSPAAPTALPPPAPPVLGCKGVSPVVPNTTRPPSSFGMCQGHGDGDTMGITQHGHAAKPRCHPAVTTPRGCHQSRSVVSVTVLRAPPPIPVSPPVTHPQPLSHAGAGGRPRRCPSQLAEPVGWLLGSAGAVSPGNVVPPPPSLPGAAETPPQVTVTKPPPCA